LGVSGVGARVLPTITVGSGWGSGMPGVGVSVPGGGRFRGPAGGALGQGLVFFLVRRGCCRR
jgi:hypothetical protein